MTPGGWGSETLEQPSAGWHVLAAEYRRIFILYFASALGKPKHQKSHLQRGAHLGKPVRGVLGRVFVRVQLERQLSVSSLDLDGAAPSPQAQKLVVVWPSFRVFQGLKHENTAVRKCAQRRQAAAEEEDAEKEGEEEEEATRSRNHPELLLYLNKLLKPLAEFFRRILQNATRNVELLSFSFSFSVWNAPKMYGGRL